MRQLMGWEPKGRKDPLRGKIHRLSRGIGRAKANYHKEGKSLGYADDAGNFIVTPEGLEVRRIVDAHRALFSAAKGVKRLPVEGRWDSAPLGRPGDLKPPVRFSERPRLKRPVRRGDGLTIMDGAKKAVIALGDCGRHVRKLAEELAWHLEQMSDVRFEIVDGEPARGPALVYRTARCPEGFARGEAAYFKIWREGDKVYLGGEDTGKSRATTYVLESLGCRYIWPGESGKVIPKRKRIILPDIAVEDATPFVYRQIRLYRRPHWHDRKGNRDFYQWHGMNDMTLIAVDRPGGATGFSWGHFYGDFYSRYYGDHREWFALQPDGTRTLNLGPYTERPTFCLSNPELAKETGRRLKEIIRGKPNLKSYSICLPDSATSTQCMCEECRRLDPVNAPKGVIAVFFPDRRSVPYVSSTDRVFTYMNRVAREVSQEYPKAVLACYAYGNYTAPPVRTVPHRNLMILSTVGNYTNFKEANNVERNLAGWKSFGNRLLWRPNVHMGFGMASPENFSRRIFADISLMAENGIFGVDYDTMGSEWATKALMYYMVCRAHYNPDRLDYDTLLVDYCWSGFRQAWKPVREYFLALERACDRAASENTKSPPALTWQQRFEQSYRLMEFTDYDRLDSCIDEAKSKADGDGDVLRRIERLEFAAGLGRRMKKVRSNAATPAERDEARRYIGEYLRKDPSAYPVDHPSLSVPK